MNEEEKVGRKKNAKSIRIYNETKSMHIRELSMEVEKKDWKKNEKATTFEYHETEKSNEDTNVRNKERRNRNPQEYGMPNQNEQTHTYGERETRAICACYVSWMNY